VRACALDEPDILKITTPLIEVQVELAITKQLSGTALAVPTIAKLKKSAKQSTPEKNIFFFLQNIN